MFKLKLNRIIGTKEPEKHIIGENPDDDLIYLLKVCKSNLKNYNESLIKKAFHASLTASKNKIRKSGDPHYTHPLSVALIVAKEIPLDTTSVVSALLHDILDEDEKYTKKDIKIEFGSEVANIVEGIHKIDIIEMSNVDTISQMDNYRKLLLSLFRDVRIILIKLADRLHNMRTIEFLSPQGQLKMANETLKVYAPFANRFGLRNIKWELEDLSFKIINNKAYKEIRKALKGTRDERNKYIDELIEPLRKRLSSDDFLKKNKAKFTISGRAKHIYSIYNKMIARNKTIEELYDILAIRVIIEHDDPFLCFYIYGIVASIYNPIPGTFKDYISNPKKNGYKSIHTAIAGPDNKFVELQIRTLPMHLQSEKGLAAHFVYKPGEVEGSTVLDSRHIQSWIKIVRELFENIGDETTDKLLDNVRRNLFIDEIYIFSPAGELITLPKDSSPLDYAFYIHSKLGLNYIGAKVNGKVVPMDYMLKSGDQIEIMTSKNHEPKADWLKYATTAKAKSSINKFIRDKRRKTEILGHEKWNAGLAENHLIISRKSFNILLETLNFSEKSDFFFAIGNNNINLEDIYKLIIYKLNENPDKISENKQNGYEKKDILFEKTELGGNRNLMLIDLKFSKGENFFELKIKAYETKSLVSDITSCVISLEDVAFERFEFDINDSKFEAEMSVCSQNKSQIKELLYKLNAVTGIQSITMKN